MRSPCVQELIGKEERSVVKGVDSLLVTRPDSPVLIYDPSPSSIPVYLSYIRKKGIPVGEESRSTDNGTTWDLGHNDLDILFSL